MKLTTGISESNYQNGTLSDARLSDHEENGEGRPVTIKESANERIPFSKICGVNYWWWPTYKDIMFKISMAIIVLLIWGATYASVGHYAAPGGGIFNLGVLITSSYIVARIGSYFALPPLIGMLLVGVFFRNMGVFDIKTTVDSEILSQIRCLALTLLLIRAGLGLDATALRRISTVVLRLALTPCLMETLGLAFSSHFILDFPLQWGLLLGSALGAVSPAVTVNYLLALKEQGYGENHGIPTLIIAASSIDDILAIMMFGIMVSVIFSSGSILTKILMGPAEICIGVIFGAILGTMSVFLPHETLLYVAFYRSVILGFGSFFAVLGSRRFEMIGAGYMTSIISSFVASSGWKRLNWRDGGKPVQNGFSMAWKVMQHFLFVLIGYELDLTELTGLNAVLQISTLTCGLIVRMATTFLLTFGAGFNLKEKLFITIAWIPKATVQAALGPTALDLVKKYQRGTIEHSYAETVLSVAVLGILITAPLGALGILFTGPRLLSKEPSQMDIFISQLPAPEKPKERKGLFSCFPRREKLVDYMKLHRRSFFLTMEHPSLNTVV